MLGDKATDGELFSKRILKTSFDDINVTFMFQKNAFENVPLTFQPSCQD